MKKAMILATGLALAALPLGAIAQQQCVNAQTITLVEAGDSLGPLGGQNGNSVHFTTASGHQYAMYEWSNLGTARGRAMYKTLLVALAGRYKITAYDHHAPYCDDVDEVWIHSD